MHEPVKTVAARLIEKQREEHAALVRKNIEAFCADMSEGRVAVTSDPNTGDPVIEWRGPAGWHLAHKNTLQQIETETALTATWNGCPSCPVKIQPTVAKNEQNWLKPLAVCLAKMAASKAGSAIDFVQEAQLVGAIERAIGTWMSVFKTPQVHIGQCHECCCEEMRAKSPEKEGVSLEGCLPWIPCGQSLM